jgi:thiamine-triphosphatase
MFRITAVLYCRQMLEVERKFAPTLASIDLLTRNAGHPSFRKFESVQSTAIEDVYYDKDDMLNSKGIYIRRRSYLNALETPAQQWEAKVKVGGDFTNSAFQELHGLEAVSELVAQHLKADAVARAQLNPLDRLRVWAHFVTNRRQWRVNEKFLVVLDEADFGHVVGEVEILQDSREQAAKSSRSDVIEQLDKQIEDFMLCHAWAFPLGKVQGKLTAYFAAREQKNES